jgi:hypothetical protein
VVGAVVLDVEGVTRWLSVVRSAPTTSTVGVGGGVRHRGNQTQAVRGVNSLKRGKCGDRNKKSNEVRVALSTRCIQLVPVEDEEGVRAHDE